MTYRVGLTSRADFELDAAANWWAIHRSPAQAARWYAGFSDALAGLAAATKRDRS